MDIKQFLSSQRNYDLRFHENYQTNDEPFYGQVCYEVFSAPAYIYEDFDNVTCGLHRTCAESPRKIQHPLHPEHPLEANCIPLEWFGSISIIRGLICDGCRHFSFGFGYYCHTCPFKLDFRCASEGKMEIKADFHNHSLHRFFHNKLSLSSQLQDITCSYCSKGFNGSAFACIKCSLFIHESCILKVPHAKQIRSPLHLKHPLVLRLSETDHHCRACQATLRRGDLYLGCKDSGTYNFHISCCSFATPGLRLKQYHEKHPLYYLYSGCEILYLRTCAVCNNICEKSHIYGCLSCDVYLHMECIPIPSVVKSVYHTYEDHALTLCNSRNLLDRSIDEYCCTICEKKGNLNHPFYHCEPCSEIAHVDCVLSEDDPPLEIVECLVPKPVKLFSIDESSPPEKSDEEEEIDDEEKACLKGCSTPEIDERIIAIKNQIDKLTFMRKSRPKGCL